MYPMRPPHPMKTIREPGESVQTLVVDRPSQFDGVFDRFVAEMGPYKVIAINFKIDDVDGNGKKSSSKNAAKSRRRRMRKLRNRFGDAAQGSAQSSQYPTMPQFDAGDNGNGGVNDNYDEDLDDGDGDLDDEDDAQERTEEDICEEARQKCYEYGKVALISISTVHGTSLLIRTCHFSSMPNKLIQMIEGKEFLKVGFGIQADKVKFYEKYGHFVLNFVDPRRPLFTWTTFFENYHFERFGVYSVASHLFNSNIQNAEAAACLCSLWSAPELNRYLMRAAARETQLTIDIYSEMCVQMLGRRGSGFFFNVGAPKEPEFYNEILSVSEHHINNGFDMKDFGVRVFSTPALQRRYRRNPCGVVGGSSYINGVSSRETVPKTFADRVRLRRSKSSVEKYWKTSILYASFDNQLFCRPTEAPVSHILTRQVDDVIWEMKIDIIDKVGRRVPVEFMPNIRPALSYYGQVEPLLDESPPEEDQDMEPPVEDYSLIGLGEDWCSKMSVQEQQQPPVVNSSSVQGMWEPVSPEDFVSSSNGPVGNGTEMPAAQYPISKGRGRRNGTEDFVNSSNGPVGNGMEMPAVQYPISKGRGRSM